MNGHPQGVSLTRELLALGAVLPPCRILDIGAGDGESVRLLDALGYSAAGIDLVAHDPFVQRADMRAAPFADHFFDAVLAECSILISGSAPAVFAECLRLLRPLGKLLISDVFFGEHAPLLSEREPATPDGWRRLAAESGFSVIGFADKSAAWKQYYIECVWSGSAEQLPEIYKDARGAGYFLMVCQRS